MLEEYEKQIAERAALGIVPRVLDAGQTAQLVELLKAPPAGREAQLLELIRNRVAAGVDQAAYVKAAFLAAVVRGEAKSPVINLELAVELLGMMHGGYNIEPLIACLDEPPVGGWRGAGAFPHHPHVRLLLRCGRASRGRQR